MSERTSRRRAIAQIAATAFAFASTKIPEYAGEIILVHGYNGVPNTPMHNEFSSLAGAKLHSQVIIPDLPLSNEENSILIGRKDKLMDRDKAAKEVADLIIASHKPPWLIGHSAGAFIAALALSNYEVEVAGLALVAMRYRTPVEDDFLKRCYREGLDPASTVNRMKGRPILGFYSTDDGVVRPPETNMNNVVEAFGAIPYLANDKGHFDRPQDTGFIINVLSQYMHSETV